MTRKSIIMMSTIGVALLAVVYAGYGRAQYEALRHTRVTIQAHPRPSANIEQVREVSRKLQAILHNVPLPVGSAQHADAPITPTAPRSITGAQFLAQLERQAPLTIGERSSLSRVLKIAADMQPGIDAEPSPDNRLAYQQQLIDSIQLRFKLILKDESRIAMARATLQGLPRISPDA